MCQLIDLGHLTVNRGLLAITRRQLAIACSLSTFLSRPGAIIRCAGAIVSCARAISRRPLSVVPSPERLPFSSAEIGRLAPTVLRLGAGVPRLSHPIACRGHLSTPIRSGVPRGPSPQASASLPIAKMGCAVAPRGTAIRLTRPLGRFLIAGDLVLFRGCLIAIRSGLIPIRSRLITVRCRLILR